MVDIIFSICEIIILLSFLSKKMLTLRVLTVIGMLGYVIGAYIAGYDLPGMTSVMIFSAIYAIVNIYQSLIIIIERVPILLPESIKQLYTNNFRMMTPGEFNRIYKSASIKKYQLNDILSVQGEPIDELIIIVRGCARVLKNSRLVATLSSEDFIGEMSLVWGGPATASVEVAEEQTECIVWNKEALLKQMQNQPQLYLKFKQAIAANLVKKLNTAGIGD
jgi:hypothetical protein